MTSSNERYERFCAVRKTAGILVQKGTIQCYAVDE